MDWQLFKQQNPTLSRHKRIINKFEREPVICRRLYSNLFADTIHAFKNVEHLNDGFKYIMVVIDCLSRRLFAQGMKTLTVDESAQVLGKIFSQMNERRGHTHFETDQGPEFSDGLLPFLEKWQMSPIKLQGQHKASLAERVM